jgi:hypothetical protein
MCSGNLHWSSDFTCEERYGCDCEEGFVGNWYCCNCKAMFEILMNCRMYEDLY